MSKYYVVLSDAERQLVEDKTYEWFEEMTNRWDEKKDPSAMDLFVTLFIDGTNIYLPNGVIVHTKLTAEKFKNYIGEAEYAALKDTCIAEGKALACGIATEIIVWQWIKYAMAIATGPVGAAFVWVCGFAVDYAVAMMVYKTMKEIFMPKVELKEVKTDDKGIQEVC